MNQGSSPSSTLVPAAGETLLRLLERIQRLPSRRIIVDAGAHSELRDSGLTRRLLSVAASDLGKELVFLLPKSAARTNPPKESVSSLVFTPRARRSVPPTSGPKQPSRLPSSPRVVLPLFAGGAGVLLAIVVLFVLPRAAISVKVATEPLTADVALTLDAREVEARPESGVVAARITRAEREISGSFPVETTLERGERASGTVTLVNETLSAQGIKVETRLRSPSGIILRTQRDALLPPLGRVPTPVRAEVGGAQGNLQTQRLEMPGLPTKSRQVLYGVVEESLRGGSDRLVRVVGEADITRASRELVDRFSETLKAETRAIAENFERPELFRVLVENGTAEPRKGTEADLFTLRARFRGERFVITAESLRLALRAALRLRAGEGREVVHNVSLDRLRILDVQWENKRASLLYRVETRTVPDLRAEDLALRLRGRTAAEAASFLRALPGVRSATVSLSPVWVRTVPSRLRNIHVRVDPE